LKRRLLLNRRKVDLSQERALLINLITSDKYCKNILPRTTPRLLKAENAKISLKWIKSYYERYKKAPSSNLKLLYTEHTERESEAVKESISEYLSQLVEEFEDRDETNTDYEIDNAKKYLKHREIEVSSKEALAYLEKGKLDRAGDVLSGYSRSKETFGDIVSNIEESAVSSSKLIKENIAEPKVIIDPWLTDGNISMLYAPRGIGKTWLALTISVMVTRKRLSENSIGPWEAISRCGALYIDGEMAESTMQKRIASLKEVYGEENEETPLTLLAASRYAKNHGAQINISSEEYRSAIYQYLYDREEYQLLVIDNISSLTPGLNENSKEDWDPINQWLISLRHLGMAVLLIHHAGKGNKQRGTSGREDALDCIINLRPSTFKRNNGGARFTVTFQKSRNVQPGPGLFPFDLALVESEDGRIGWERIYYEEEQNN
jgi:hypothetical protein